MNENLQRASELGQGIWIDSISRDDLVEGGALQQRIEEGVVGVTSNPTIFQKAISESSLYDDQLEEVSRETDDPKEIFLQLAKDDIQNACDVLSGVHQRTAGKDGYVSLEVSPNLAYDTPATVEEAMRLHEIVDRPNLLVKIPATQPGLSAIEEVIANGKSVNVTLIFSLARYRAVARAYIRGLQRLVAAGGDPSTVASVASFFVSRVDSEADKRLDEVDRPDLQGRLAIDNAKLAYAEFEETLEATMDHGDIHLTIKEGLEEARRLPRMLAEAGVDYDDVTETLEKEGVEKFEKSFDEMLEVISEKSRRLVSQS